MTTSDNERIWRLHYEVADQCRLEGVYDIRKIMDRFEVVLVEKYQAHDPKVTPFRKAYLMAKEFNDKDPRHQSKPDLLSFSS